MLDQVRNDLSVSELPQDLHFNKYAQQILENGKSVAASTPTITTLSGSEFLQKLSASILNHIQTQVWKQNNNLTTTSTTTKTIAAAISPSSATSSSLNMDFEIVPNHVVIGSSDFDAMDELQKQLDYDKFMNEVWIGIVFTLVLISMVFCICSCFLYHQFRTWKRNYNASIEQSQALDIESMKLNPEHEDPVPEYTLVSGLPSYEAALELLHKTPNSCVIMYPSLFGVFNKHEKSAINMTDLMATLPQHQQQQQHQRQQLQQQLSINEAARPLLATDTLVKSLTPQYNNNTASLPSYTDATIIASAATATTTIAPMPFINEQSKKAPLTSLKEAATSVTTTTTTMASTTTPTTTPPPTQPTPSYAILQKVPSYEQALLVKTDRLL